MYHLIPEVSRSHWTKNQGVSKAVFVPSRSFRGESVFLLLGSYQQSLVPGPLHPSSKLAKPDFSHITLFRPSLVPPLSTYKAAVDNLGQPICFKISRLATLTSSAIFSLAFALQGSIVVCNIEHELQKIGGGGGN